MSTPEDLGIDADKRKVLHQRLANIRYRLDHDLTSAAMASHNETQIVRCVHELTAILDTILKALP